LSYVFSKRKVIGFPKEREIVSDAKGKWPSTCVVCHEIELHVLSHDVCTVQGLFGKEEVMAQDLKAMLVQNRKRINNLYEYIPLLLN
jgi:hypothetical protein